MRLKTDLAANVKTLRTRLGMSQEELGDTANLHRSYVSGIERGTRNPTLEVLQRLASALNVSVSELLRRRREQQ